jgi:hypothetical protein
MRVQLWRLALIPLLCLLATFQAQGDIRLTEPTLVIDDLPIMVFRGFLVGLSPKERARGAQQRVDDALKMHGNDSVTVEEIPQGTAVLIHGDIMFVVTPNDLPKNSGMTTQMVAQQAVLRLSGKDYPARIKLMIRKSWPVILFSMLAATIILLPRFWRWKNMVCPVCGNADRSLISIIIDETSSFWILHRYFCHTCGQGWVINGWMSKKIEPSQVPVSK